MEPAAGIAAPYENGKKTSMSKPGSKSSDSAILHLKNQSLHRANQIEKEQELRQSKNLERILQLQDEKVKQGIGVVRKMKVVPTASQY